MGNFNYFVAILIVILSYIVTKIFLHYSRTGLEKLCLIFLSIFTVIYSGLGISFRSVDKIYLFSFFAFFVFLLSGLCLGFRMLNIKKEFRFINSLTGKNSIITNIVAIVYWLILIVRLVYPVNKFMKLLNPSISVIDVFSNQIASRENMIVYLLGILILLIRPVYYIFLIKMKSNILPSLLIFLEIYIGVAINGYMGRSGAIVNVLLMILVFVYKRGYSEDKAENRMKYTKFKLFPKIVLLKSRKRKIVNLKDENSYLIAKRVFTIIAIVVILMAPLLFEYQYYRLGAHNQTTSIIDKINGLMEIEFSFPKLYNYASISSENHSPIEYFKWLVTLIVPKQLLPVGEVILINYKFSSSILGIEYGEPGFYVFLPSVLGEAIMLYGNYLVFIHGFILGIIIGAFLSFYQKSKSLLLWNIYVVCQLIFMPRGGSQGTISLFINGSLLLFLFAFIDVLYPKKKNSMKIT